MVFVAVAKKQNKKKTFLYPTPCYLDQPEFLGTRVIWSHVLTGVKKIQWNWVLEGCYSDLT